MNKLYNLNEVDFEYSHKDSGHTIFLECFEYHAYEKSFHKTRKLQPNYIEPRSIDNRAKIVPQIEDMFFFLVKEAQKRNIDIDRILEIPGNAGQTCFHKACECSEKIAKFILERDIDGKI